MIVVDASVAVKWFIPEAGEEAAAKLLGGKKRLIAPALIRLEVTGTLGLSQGTSGFQPLFGVLVQRIGHSLTVLWITTTQRKSWPLHTWRW
jgi:predicted nucleic acid-binding protein